MDKVTVWKTAWVSYNNSVLVNTSNIVSDDFLQAQNGTAHVHQTSGVFSRGGGVAWPRFASLKDLQMQPRVAKMCHFNYPLYRMTALLHDMHAIPTQVNLPANYSSHTRSDEWNHRKTTHLPRLEFSASLDIGVPCA